MARPVMPRWLVVGVLAGLVVAAALFVFWGRTVVAPSPEAQAVMTDWLTTTCQVGEGADFEDALRTFGVELETPLIDLFQSGPATSDVRRVESAARREFERTLALINSGAPTGLPANDVEALRKTSVNEWVTRAGEDFVAGRRAAALAGLGVTGGNKGRRLLDQIASDPNSPYNGVARLAGLSDSPRAPN